MKRLKRLPASVSHTNNNLHFSIELCSGLEQAVKVAARVVKPGDIVLLSPGGTSFDEFRDFEDRGEAFKRWVLESFVHVKGEVDR